VSPADIKKPAISRRSLVPVDCILPYDISFKWLDENIEKRSAEAAINKAFAAQFSNDLVDLMINGDKSAGSGVDQKFLQITDGLKIKLIADTNTHFCDRGSSTDWKGQVFPALMKALPSKYKTDPSKLLFLTGFDLADEYITSLAERTTALGDIYLTEGRMALYKGIAVQPVPSIPYGMVILTNPKNLAVGFGSNIKVYKQLKPRELNIEYTITTRVDFNYADSNGIVFTV
jgi:Cobyrinic acid a,c-diamide synthase